MMGEGLAAALGADGGECERPLGVVLDGVSDLFPLPLLPSPNTGAGSSRSSRQKEGRREKRRCDMNDALIALNWLAGKREPPIFRT